jgi:hypothetical protein
MQYRELDYWLSSSCSAAQPLNWNSRVRVDGLSVHQKGKKKISSRIAPSSRPSPPMPVLSA